MTDSRDQQLSWVETSDLLKTEAFPPRREEKAPEQLVSSMRIHGIITPVLARPTSNGLQIVCGMRRVHAAKVAGLQKVPTLIANLEDVEAIRCFLNENQVRRHLDQKQVEEALGLLRRMRDAGDSKVASGESERDLEQDVALRSEETRLFEYDETEAEALLDSAFGEDGVDASQRGCDSEATMPLSSSPPPPRRHSKARPWKTPKASASKASTSGAEDSVHLERKSSRVPPARWELEDLVERTQEFFLDIRKTRQVELPQALSIVEELAGIQSDGLPLRPEHVYGADHEGSWLAPHSVLVASLNMVLAPVGCSEEERRSYGLAGLLHDIGMAFFEDRGLLESSAALTEEQRAEMKRHTWLGHAILSSHDVHFPDLSAAARDHHERPDGSGYPQGLRRNEISLVARVTAMSDVFAALVGPRPHRAAATPETALECVLRNYGFTEFEAGLAARLERLYRDVDQSIESDAPNASVRIDSNESSDVSSTPSTELGSSRIVEISALSEKPETSEIS